MSYTPTPIETQHIDLADGLDRLVEDLARHVHDTWAKRRMNEGWTYGHKRDDAAKTHPGLVPYEELSETEKEYDRQTAMETLRATVALGYEIVLPVNTDGQT